MCGSSWLFLGKVDNNTHPEDGGGGSCHPGCEDTQSLGMDFTNHRSLLQNCSLHSMLDSCHHHLVETWLQLCSQGCSSGLTKSPKATAAFAWRQLPGQLWSYFSDFIQLPGSFRSFFLVSKYPQVSNVSIFFKCQLISIYQQRGRKLTCAAEEPATTTVSLRDCSPCNF